MSKLVLILSFVVSAAAFAQAPATEFSPPPMVPVTPPPTPAPEPGTQLVDPGTPPPPSAVPPSGSLPPPNYLPQQPSTGYPYSPYGTPRQQQNEKPPLEWGLMISESLFGMLTSAGVSLIPYFLLLRPMVTQNQVLGDATISTVVFVLIFSALPLAVSQTQLSLANGSRHYYSESWPAALAGLGAQAAILGLFFAFQRAPSAIVDNGLGGVVFEKHNTEMSGRNEIFLLIGSIGIVPLVQMAVINLTKSPRAGRLSAVSRDDKGKIALGMPAISPLVAQTRLGMSVGVQASLLNFAW